ncbi:MAG: BPL-N domain-containing protein [Planctomycetota bacterium]|nr:BPL-N domain-containing protein [Planctomycetota bacterium]
MLTSSLKSLPSAAALCLCLSSCEALESSVGSFDGAWMNDSGPGSGPTVLVFAGGRPGQEMPRLAVKQVAAWEPVVGRLVAVSFSGEELPESFARYITQLDPDWVLELRQDFYHARAGLETLGGTVIHQGGTAHAELAARMSEAVNATVSEEADKFHARHLDGALRVHGRAGLALVTSARKNTTPTMDHRPAKLVRQQRLMLHAFLGELGMLREGASPDQGLTRATQGALRFAVYDGEGAGRPMPFIVDIQEGIQGAVGYPLSPEEMAAGALGSFDVVLFPGGMASHQFDALGAEGREAVVSFVRNGGGYVGICAGAYMAASAPYQWGLSLLDAGIIDHDHWARGIGPVEVELSPLGLELFGDFHGRQILHYGQGPIVAPALRPEVPDYEVLAWYRSGIGENGADPEVMVGTPAIIRGSFGKGRVLASSGHAEWSSGLESFLLRYFEWAGGRRD